jgi:hypothetical protein
VFPTFLTSLLLLACPTVANNFDVASVPAAVAFP